MGMPRRIDGNRRILLAVVGTVGLIGLCIGADSPNTPTVQSNRPFNAQVGRGDWPQLGGSPHRNNTPVGMDIPTEWNIQTGENIKWSAKLGTVTYGNVVVANGQIFVGTNNGAGYLKRYPSKIDLGVLLCFRESDGEFLWQHSSEKLPTAGFYDLPMTGIYSAPVVEGERLWFVTNRGEVVCLDTQGFQDEQNDGPFTSEKPVKPEVDWDEQHEADVVWSFNMMQDLGVSPHERTPCSPTIWGDVLFICTSNGVDQGHIRIPAPDAPSFIALDKHTGKVLWTDNSPGNNILHCQWSSPAVGVFNGVPQVLFPGGDGWLYSFRADRWNEKKPELLWKFDGNAKNGIFLLGGRSTRLPIIAIPVIYDGLVYLAMGEDPEHGEGLGHLWCIDPKKRGDVSPELVVDSQGNVVPHQRFHAIAAPIGGVSLKDIPNPNSAVVWDYISFDKNGDGKTEYEETMHRTLSSPTIKDDVLIIPDFSGLVHCLNAKTGKPYWTYDALAAIWCSPLIVDGHMYVADEDGDVTMFSLSSDPEISRKAIKSEGNPFPEPLHEINMEQPIYTMPVVANNVLYIAVKNELFAITEGGKGS